MNSIMKLISPLFLICSLLPTGSFGSVAEKTLEPIQVKVSMENPNNHYFHVEMECKGLDLDTCHFVMPAWTPGYYWILNLSGNVTNFSASDIEGNELNYTKSDKNTWDIYAANSGPINISYDVFALKASVAEPFLDDGRAFISPTGIFMYPKGKKECPVMVEIIPPENWKQINTGLQKVENQVNTFFASNFDVLYDSPVLIGNQENWSFEVDGIPYILAKENLASLDVSTYIDDLKKIISSATGIIDDVPYNHYTFIEMQKGYGGLEHSNSMVVFSNAITDVTKSEGYKGWLSFIAHEFFHLYNIKTIRPIVLSPFDYTKENLTNMLWVAEGFTVYYEYLILNRAGLMSRQETLDALSNVIAKFENAPGRAHTSATQSSFDTWLNFFNHNNHTQNTVISYYDIGCALGMLIDLKIRHETNNKKSLDDVMRTLYYDFHKQKNRGYTDQEFREVCENIAGCSLEEIFQYAETTEPMDYQKYLDYAGIEMNLEPEKELSFGLNVRGNNDNLIITDINRGSPAWKRGLSINDKIISINDELPNDIQIGILKHPKKESSLKIKVERRTGTKEFKIETFVKESRDFKMAPIESSTSKLLGILNSWIIK